MGIGALASLKVLEAGTSVGVAYCGKLLSGCGAQVVKVEAPNSGDPTRAYGPFPDDVPHPEKSGLFAFLNTNKKSITLNLERETGVGIFHRLVKDADVVIENWNGRDAHGMALDYEALDKVNPSVTVVSITPYGQTGPYRDFKASEATVFALSGYMDLTGLPEREPLKAYGSSAEFQSGVCAAVGVMGAIWAREAIGSGQYMDISVLESLHVHTGMAPFEYMSTGELAKRAGSGYTRFRAAAASLTLPCKNGHVHVHALGPPGMLAVLTGESRLTDPELSKEDFLSLLGPWLMARDKQEIVALAQELRLPFTEVSEVDELVVDVQHQAREAFPVVDHPVLGSLAMPGPPFRMDETPLTLERAPLLGEHNELIYCGLPGFSKSDLVRLRQQGLV